MNDRDAPIWQNPSYWPVISGSRRTGTEKHRQVEVTRLRARRPVNANHVERFRYPGLDILTGGTLDKNISFLLVPSADETGAFHFESVWARWTTFSIRLG